MNATLPLLTEPASDCITVPDVAERFAATMEQLIDAILLQSDASRVPRPIVIMIWSFITSLTQRFAKIIARGPARRSANPTRRVSTTLTTTIMDKAPKPPKPEKRPLQYAISRGFCWLRHAMPVRYGPIAMMISALTDLLAEAEMTDLIAIKPALGKVLRPLCHLLGIKRPPSLQLPKPVKPKQYAAPRPPKPRRPRQPPSEHPIPMGPGNRFWPPWLKAPEKTA